MHLESDNEELMRRLEDSEDAVNRLKGELLEKQLEMEKLAEKIKVWNASFIHSSYFYSTSSSPLLLKGALDTAWILCWNFTVKRHRQLREKDLPKVPREEFDPATLRTRGGESTNEPSHLRLAFVA